jgi:hypothetical protein
MLHLKFYIILRVKTVSSFYVHAVHLFYGIHWQYFVKHIYENSDYEAG